MESIGLKQVQLGKFQVFRFERAGLKTGAFKHNDTIVLLAVANAATAKFVQIVREFFFHKAFLESLSVYPFRRFDLQIKNQSVTRRRRKFKTVVSSKNKVLNY